MHCHITHLLQVGANEPLAFQYWGSTIGMDLAPPELKRPGSVLGISGGHRHVLVLRSDLSVAAFGDDAFMQTSLPEPVTRPGSVKAVAAGKYHCLALTVDGNVVQWGQRDAGVPPAETLTGNIVSIFAGDASSCALSADGNVHCWGDSVTGSETKPVTQALPTELSSMTGLRDIRLTVRNGWMALFNNGTLHNYTVADGEALPSKPQVVEGVAQLAVSVRSLPIHSVVLFRNGSSVGWGRDNEGQASRPAREVQDAVKVAAGIDTVRCVAVSDSCIYHVCT
jgi:alpha-tubulin suppressor-like RCC1 family protein